ncbi:hypothetical protein CTEN210_17912 [Chaetoceros tenuissimus]|uniref:Uncharacterized protein n=1 Tax=Chaetoceros tenuissimus TaxID=426638 RepID=A0AAD3DBR5_9STRA|nr:hypothetical protein CTEN210_17912 [Chaetoceros tenuissimus]
MKAIHQQQTNRKKKKKSARRIQLVLLSSLVICWTCLFRKVFNQSERFNYFDLNSLLSDSINSTNIYNGNDTNLTSNRKQRKKLLFILGAGRSGTSTLAGLFITLNIYYGGNRLKPASIYNQKGYFEDEDLVIQDKFMVEDQKFREFLPLKFPFNNTLAIEKIRSNENGYFDKGGRDFLKRVDLFENNQDGNATLHSTFVVKDPLASITLPTWLEFLEEKPVVLFTHRHPVDVARSLRKRNANIISNQGLMYSIGYNQNSIQNSIQAGLCLVSTSYYNVMNDSLNEVRRIVAELQTKCHVEPSIPISSISGALVDGFVDHGLRHDFEKPKELGDTECELDDWGLKSYKKANLVDQNQHNGIFFTAMKIYCDIENGKAFEKDYEWPEVSKMKRKE